MSSDTSWIRKLCFFRFNQWKLLVNQGLLQNFELYNIEKDPQELDNQILEHPDVFRMMLEKYNVKISNLSFKNVW